MEIDKKSSSEGDATTLLFAVARVTPRGCIVYVRDRAVSPSGTVACAGLKIGTSMIHLHGVQDQTHAHIPALPAAFPFTRPRSN